MIKSISFVAGLGCLALVAAGTSMAQPKKTKMKKVTYAQVAPLLAKQCISCHNPERHPEKVDLSNYKAVMASGEHHPVVSPGHPEKSSLISYVNGDKKPRMPMGKPPLSTADVALLRAWVKGGALP